MGFEDVREELELIDGFEEDADFTFGDAFDHHLLDEGECGVTRNRLEILGDVLSDGFGLFDVTFIQHSTDELDREDIDDVETAGIDLLEIILASENLHRVRNLLRVLELVDDDRSDVGSNHPREERVTEFRDLRLSDDIEDLTKSPHHTRVWLDWEDRVVRNGEVQDSRIITENFGDDVVDIGLGIVLQDFIGLRFEIEVAESRKERLVFEGGDFIVVAIRISCSDDDVFRLDGHVVDTSFVDEVEHRLKNVLGSAVDLVEEVENGFLGLNEPCGSVVAAFAIGVAHELFWSLVCEIEDTVLVVHLRSHLSCALGFADAVISPDPEWNVDLVGLFHLRDESNDLLVLFDVDSHLRSPLLLMVLVGSVCFLLHI